MDAIEEIFNVMESEGGRRYDAESITQLEHALQCAANAAPGDREASYPA